MPSRDAAWLPDLDTTLVTVTIPAVVQTSAGIAAGRSERMTVTLTLRQLAEVLRGTEADDA